MTIYGSLALQAHRDPTAIALVAPGGRSLTYAGLLNQVAYVVKTLNSLGLGREDRIAIVLKNGADMAVASLGVAAGATAVLLNPECRREEFDLLLSDCGAKALIAAAGDSPARMAARHLGTPLVELTPTLDVGVFTLSGEKTMAQERCGFAEPHEKAFILYTSGTTSGPKGVPLTHANVYTSAQQIRSTLHLTESDRCLNVMPLFHVHGLVGALLSSLIAGGSVVCAPGLVIAAFIEWLHTFAPTWYSVVPTMHQEILTLGSVHHKALENSSLRFIRSSSARLPQPVLQDLERVFKIPVIEAYGMTEASHQITSNSFLPADRKAGSVGKALGCEVAIVGKTGHFLAPGHTGEIVIRGDNVTHGYLGGEDLNDKVSVDGWFRTGDLGALDLSGDLFITGRLKEVINRGGEMVSPLEIEDALFAFSDIVEAVAFPVSHPTLGEDIAAAVVLRKGATITPDAVREMLFRKLADFKVPSRVLLVNRIPKGPGMKLRRSTLSEHFSDRLHSHFVAPLDEREATLANILRGVLNVAEVGVDDNFFALGGNSLSAMQVISRIRDQLRADLSVADILRNPTIAQLMQVVTKRIVAENDPMLRSISAAHPGEDEAPGEASFSQQRLWLLHELYAVESALNQPYAVNLKGALEVPILRSSLGSVIARHEAFRTSFALHDGKLLQRIAEPQPVDVPVLDLRSYPERDRNSKVQALLDESIQRPFDLSRDLLLRALVLRTGDDEWVLLIVIHHTAIDGWSRTIFLRELSAVYQRFLAGVSEPLPGVGIAYRHYSEWQRRQIRSGAWVKQLDYWRRQVAGIPVLELPTDRPQPIVPRNRGALHVWTLPSRLIHGLSDLIREEAVTLFMVLMAVFQTLLHRYSGQDDIVVGTPVAGRTRPEMEQVIGVFINTLILRTDLSGSPTFRELLSTTKIRALEAYAHQDIPFEYVLSELSLDRSLSYASPFQVMFSLQNMPQAELSFPGVAVSPICLHNWAAKNQLSMTIFEIPGALRATIEYDTDLFESTTIARMAGHFETLLEAVARNPDQKLSAMPLLTSAERTQLLIDWNDTQSDFPADACIQQLFAEQAARTPDRIALMCGDRQISYRELDASANRVSSQLRKLGAGPGMTVGIYAERSLESVTGVLSVLKAGCACLPLDPDYPAERLAFMIEEVDPPVLLTQTHLAKRLPARRSRILCLDEPGLEHTDLVEGDSDVHVSAGAAAYVIYTSGSSGQPKAVVIDHRHIVNRLAWMWNTYPFDSDDVGCQKCSLSFLDSIWEIFVALLKGVPTAIIMDHELKDLNMFVARLAQHHVTRVIQIVPSLLRVLLHTFPDLERRLPEVKLWLTSGEELSVDLYQRYRERLPQSTLCNVYGCSEATGTWYEPKAGENQGARFPIGRPITNIRTYVLDQHLQAVPVGVTGELYFSGVSVARGYLNRPRLSREKFFTHSFDGIDAQRLYKTGDLVRWRSDGHIEFIGRVDNQVKLRGSRIELGEIEAALCAHPAVSESIVTLFEDRPGDGRLIAYVAAAEVPLRPAELRASLKRKLPTHMLPPVIMVLESLPLNANGKVNRNALPMPDPGRQDLDNSFVAPRTVVEKALAFIWSDLLKVDQIGIEDDFFELGGHSIQAMQVVSRVRDTLGVELALRSLFDAPTVIGLAEVVEAARESGTHRINTHTGPRFA